MTIRPAVLSVSAAVVMAGQMALAQAPGVRITYLYDNTATSPAVKADWGFACLLEAHGHTVLFDTGTRPDIFGENLKALKVDLTRVEALVFSHPHGDHTLGAGALPAMAGLPAYLGEHFTLPPQADASFTRMQVKRMPVPAGRAVEVFPGIAAGPEMFGSNIYELPLVVETPDGLIVIVGCSHPGIVAMLKRIAADTRRPIHMVIGGFHLMQTPADQVRTIIGEFKALGVAWAGPTHCTGADAIGLFREAYGDHFIEGGVGTVVAVPRR